MTARSEDEAEALHTRVAALEAELKQVRDAQAELARQLELYRTIVASAPIGLGVADEAGELLVWNDAMLSVAGFTPAEEAKWQRARQSAEARASRARMLEVVNQRGGLFRHEFPIPQQDGSTGQAIATVKPIDAGGQRLLHLTMQDVTQHKRVEGALQESEIRFRQVAETLRQVFYITTADHRQILYVSPAYEDHWGRTCESLQAEPLSWVEAIHEEDRARVRAQVEAGAKEGFYEIEYRIVRPDGAIRWILDRAYELLDTEGRPYRIVGVAEDITDRRRLEEQLREAQKMEAVGQLAGGVAHDFNNLLTVILGNVSLLERTIPADVSHHDMLDEVKRAAMGARDLTRKLLGFSRRATLSMKPLDLRVIARDTVGWLQRAFDPRIQVVIDEPDSLGSVLADAGEMSQVLLNLCLNARDAMPEGGTLTVRTRGTVISEEHARERLDARSGEAICLSVEDTGTGIAPEVRARIFEPFYTTKEPGAGTGLGLAMAFGTVKQHRGWIEFTSELGRGTRFDVYLPVYEGAPSEPVTPAHVTPQGNKSGTILFVDDEAGIRGVVAKWLGDEGYRVLLAEDGHAAIEVFREQWRSIDLVVLDLRMPKLSGRDALTAIWAIQPEARVLVTSGHSDEYQRVVDTEPIAGCLRKPWTMNELVPAIRQALAGRNPAPVTPKPVQ